MSELAGFKVIKPGILSLIQDRGRFGSHRLGLSNGGPMDVLAFRAANRLCGNDDYSVGLEVNIGDLCLEAQRNSTIAVTGAQLPLMINGEAKALWRSHSVQVGDQITLGFSQRGCRGYLAVAGGFQLAPQLASCSTVVREGIGGLSGEALKAGDSLACTEHIAEQHYAWAEADRPVYSNSVSLRVVAAYQQADFSPAAMQRFFSSEYTVSRHCDRMGYRLEGPAITADVDGVLSEGICQGAIQCPPDGQPIILLNDRQTIGGYPKLASLISIDCGILAQLPPGSKIRFTQVSIDQAQRLLHATERRFNRLQMQRC